MVLYDDMNTTAIRWVFGLGLAAIIGILSFQVYWILTNYKSEQQEIDQKINIVLYRVAEELAKYNKSVLPRENLITRQTNNYYIVNINDVIDANVLEFYMLDEIKRMGLELDFEYGIYDCGKDQMVYGHYCDIDLNEENIENTSLPTYDKFDYYFGVRFPQLRSAVFGDLSMTLILSGLLLLTLIFFAVALYIIMSQKRLSELQRDFINNMTHELKTPLASIKIAGETFLQERVVAENPRLNRYAEIIRDQSSRLNKHVEKILDVARLESDLVQLKKKDFNLVSLVSGVLDHYKESDKTRTLTFNCQVSEGIIHGDPLHTANMFHNLIDNAIKYGGEQANVTVELESDDHVFIVRITDDGLGIDKSDLSKIFNKFYRVSTGDVHNIKGFGLGLYYVQQIIKLHRWDIAVDSQLNEFTTFTITIPKN